MSEFILHGLADALDKTLLNIVPGGVVAKPLVKQVKILADVMAPENTELHTRHVLKRDVEDYLNTPGIDLLNPLGMAARTKFVMDVDKWTGGMLSKKGGSNTKPPWLHKGEVKKPKPAGGSTKPTSYTPKPTTNYTPRPVYTPRTYPRRDADNRGNCHRNRTDSNKPWNPFDLKNMFGFDPGGVGKWFSDMLQGFFGPIAAETQSVLMAIIPIALIAIIAIIILKKAVF